MITYALPLYLFVHFSAILFLIVVLCIASGKKTDNTLAFSIGLFLVLGGLIFIFLLVFFSFPYNPDDIEINIKYNLGQKNNFVPFKTICGVIKETFSTGSFVYLRQIVGNIVLFMPFGGGIYLLFSSHKNKFKITVLLSFITSVSVEVMQALYSYLVGYTYRSADVDDILLNTLGGICEFIAMVLADKFLLDSSK